MNLSITHQSLCLIKIFFLNFAKIQIYIIKKLKKEIKEIFKTQKPNHIKKKYFQDSCKSWSNLYLAKVPLKRIPNAQNIIDLKINDKKSIKECSRLELNQRPLDFQSNALPLSYLS